MRYRSNWLTVVASTLATAVLVVGVGVPAALAKNNKPPKKTELPNGQPFKLIQQMIDGLDARVDALEAAAPAAGTLWINPFDLIATTGPVVLTAAPSGTPGLVVAAAGADTLQVGAQVPPGFGVTGAIVCYIAGLGGGSVSSLALAQNDIEPPFGSVVLVNTAPPAPGAGTESCVQTAALDTPADPSADGPLYVAVGFSGPGSITIRGIGLLLSPLP